MRNLLKHLILGLSLLACSATTAAADDRPLVFVSIQPQAWFVERIAGEAVRVEVLVGPGESPATFDPTPRRLAELARADVLLTIGVPMEGALLPELEDAMPRLRIEPVHAGIERLALEAHDHGHDHHHHHHHDHGETDPHVWLDPLRGTAIAANTCRALQSIVPADSSAMTRRLVDLQAELRALDAELTRILSPASGRTLAVFHPAYGYLAARYGLRQVAIERGGLSPSPKALAETMRHLTREKARAICVQPQFSDSEAATVADMLRLRLLRLDPLARDYPTNLRAMAAAIAEALTPEGAR